MDRCSKYSDYSGIHPMAGRIGDAVLSCGPPNRMAPNVTVVPDRHQQALRYHEQQQHRIAMLHSSEGLYQPQRHSFERYLPSVSYASYHSSSYGAAGLSYVDLGRRDAAAYLNHHTHHVPHSHHLYHPAHYDNTYSGRMIGGAGGNGPPTLTYHPYREVYEHPQGMPSSVLHYTARNSAFRYGHPLSSIPTPTQPREYPDYYPCQPFASDHRYAPHHLHSITEHSFLNAKEGVQNKVDGQHIADPEESYSQQRQQQQEQSLSASSSLSSFGIAQIASPMTSGSTTTDSGISGSSRCGSTPISTSTTSAGYSGEYSLGSYNAGEFKEESVMAMDVKDSPRSLPATPEASDNGQHSTKDYTYSPKPSCVNPSSPPSESEKGFSGQLCASNPRTDCSNSMVSTPERCGTPYMTVSRPPKNYHSPQRYQVTHKTWSPNQNESNEAQTSSPKPKKKRTITPLRTQSPCEAKKNRVVECDLIPNKRSKRKSELFHEDSNEIREEIRDIKPLPGFQQAFGSTEIGRFFETFLNIPPNSCDSGYNYESEADVLRPQPWDIDSPIDGPKYDVQINASLQSMYKNSLGDKSYLSGIRCNGY